MTKEELKTHLREIVQQNYEVTKPRAKQLLPEMLQNIGNPDPQLRDTLIYFTLATWIGKNIFDPSELHALLHTALDDKHLFYCIGEENTDSVFTRSFSVSLIPPILHVHIENAFLSLEEVQWVWRKLRHYLLNEQDLRGYVRGKGWAHAVAHATDALDALDGLAQCSEINREHLLEILWSITKVASTERSVYICDEDERLSFAIISIFKRSELSAEEKVVWLEFHLGEPKFMKSA